MEKPENANTPTMGGQCSGAADIYQPARKASPNAGGDISAHRHGVPG